MLNKSKSVLLPLIPTIYLPGLLYATSRGMLIPVLPLYTREFTNQYQLVGLVLAAEAIGMVVFDVPTGMLLNRIGRKNGMLLGAFTMGLTTALVGFTSSIWVIALLQFFTGFGIALYSVARHTYLADEVSNESRGIAIATIGGVFRGGSALGPFLGGTLIAAFFGLSATFFAVGILTLITLIIMFIAVPADPPRKEVESEASLSEEVGTHAEHNLLETLKTHWRAIAFAGLGSFFAQMVRLARRTALPLVASDVLHLDVAQIGTITSLSSLVDMPLFPVAGFLMDRFGRKFAIVPSFLLQGIGVFLIVLATGYWSLLAAALIIGLANGISAGTMMTLGADLSPLEGRSQFLGLWRLIGDGGAMIAPLLVGAIADALTLIAATGTLSLAGFIAAAIFMWLVPETLRKKKVELR